jgi:hypothetical protein
MSEVTEAPFEMANLPPRLTGLPMVVWVSERGNAPHDVRVKVCGVHGERTQWNNTASVAVRPLPHLAAGQLSPADLAVVSDWIRLNEAVLVDYWEQRIFTDE